MFDLSWGELVLIGMVALIVIGPKELPTVLRTVGQWMTRIRRMAAEFQGQFQEAMREAEFADLKKQVDSISDPAQQFKDYNPLDTIQREIDSALEDKPAAKAEAAGTDAAPSSEPGQPGATSDQPTSDQPLATSDAPPAPPAEAVQAEPKHAEAAPAEPAQAEPAPPEAARQPVPPEGGRAA